MTLQTSEQNRSQASFRNHCIFLGLTLALCTSPLGCSKTELTEGELAVQRFKFASLQASRGNCDASEDLLKMLPPSFSSQHQNRRSIAIVRARCQLFVDGDIAATEETVNQALEESGDQPGLPLSSLMVMTRLHQCRFSDAVEWSYAAQRQAPDYLSNTALPWTAVAYSLQGRPTLARRNAIEFLRQYPENWYRTTRSAPPAGVQYDQRSAHETHQLRRAELYLLLAAVGHPLRIPADELASVRLFLNPDAIHESQGLSDAYLSSETGDFNAARESLYLRGLLNLEDELRLTPSQVEALLSRLSDAYARIAGMDSACRETLRTTEMDTMALLIQRDVLQPEGETLTSLSGEQATQLVQNLQRMSSDADRDGILDDVDDCPNDPETFNGIDDKDGCPDKQLAGVWVQDNEIVFDETIQFRTDSADLLPGSVEVLEQLVAILHEYPGIRKILIEGHTDERGAASYNLELSNQRVQAVSNFLIGNGIDGSRLHAVGYGESQPVAFANNEEAWSRNRRVEMLLDDYDPLNGYKL